MQQLQRRDRPERAAAQESSAATQAIADAATFGLGKGSPIYYDMEGYDHPTPAA